MSSAWRGAESPPTASSRPIGRTLWRRRSWLLGPPEVPTGAEKNTIPPLPLGEERRRLLARSRVLLLGIAEEGPEVVSAAALQAALAGAVIVAPHDLDLAPLVAGRDYAVAEARNLAAVADALLDEPPELERLRAGAADRSGGDRAAPPRSACWRSPIRSTVATHGRTTPRSAPTSSAASPAHATGCGRS